MSDLAALEKRIQALEDIEAIKRLKYKYWRCLDTKSWDEMEECFVDDATASDLKRGAGLLAAARAPSLAG